MRSARTLVPLLAAALLLAVPASAKEGVYAKLTDPVDLSAPAGTHVTVDWTLQDQEGNPFGAGGIYLRVARCGRTALRIPAREVTRNRYVAAFKMPRRGVRKITVGLKGWRIYPSGRKERADAFFAFRPALKRRCL